MAEEGEALDSIGAVGAVDTTPADAGSSATFAPYPSRQLGSQDIQDAVKRVNDRLSSVSRVLELKVDPASGVTVATVTDSRTGQVLQQFPSTGTLHLAQMLADWAGGKNALLDLIA